MAICTFISAWQPHPRLVTTLREGDKKWCSFMKGGSSLPLHQILLQPRSSRFPKTNCPQSRIRMVAKNNSREAVALIDTSDILLSFLSEEAEVSVFVVVGTELVREAQQRHCTAPTASAALGRLLLGTLLLNALKGPEEVVQVTFSGRGPLGQMTAVAQQGQLVKGYVHNPSCDPPVNSLGKLDVSTAVGPGVLTVVRSRPSWQQPYTGTVPLQSGEVAEDFAHYLAESEQINSAVSLGVLIGTDRRVQAAGGFLVQVLPNCSDETLTRLEANVVGMPPISTVIADSGAQSIAERLLEGIGIRAASEPVNPSFGPCSLDLLKPRMMKAVEYLGADDARKLLEEQGHIEVRCEFCAETVQFDEEELQSMALL